PGAPGAPGVADRDEAIARVQERHEGAHPGHHARFLEELAQGVRVAAAVRAQAFAAPAERDAQAGFGERRCDAGARAFEPQAPQARPERDLAPVVAQLPGGLRDAVHYREHVHVLAVAPDLGPVPVHERHGVGRRRHQLVHDAREAGRRRRRQAEPPDRVAQHVAPPRLGQPLERGDGQPCRVAAQVLEIRGGELRGQLGGFREQPGAPREAGRRRGPATAQRRQDLAPQEVAIEGDVHVRGVFAPVEPVRPRMLLDLGTRHLQQGPEQQRLAERAPRADACEPGHPAAAQQVEQQRLRLVVTVVCREHGIAARAVPGGWAVPAFARRPFRPPQSACRHLDARGEEIHLERRRDPAAVFLPAAGLRLQAVVHVQREERHAVTLPREHERVQEHGGIEAAAEGDDVARRRFRRELAQAPEQALRDHGAPRRGAAPARKLARLLLHPAVRRLVHTLEGSHMTSPARRPFWLPDRPPATSPALDRDLAVDIAIGGGGIVGLTTACLLLAKGRDVAVFEARRVGRQATGRSTAKATSQHGSRYRRLLDSIGKSGARRYASANERAIGRIRKLCATFELSCGLEALPAYVYAETAEEAEALEDEAAAAAELGLPAAWLDDLELPFPVSGALRFTDQAQLDPYRYLLGLAQVVARDGALFETTRIENVEHGEPCRLAAGDVEVRAEHVVVATHMPVIGDGLYFAKNFPVAHPLAAAPLPEHVHLDGMYLGSGSPMHSFRTTERDGRRFLVPAGGEFRTGEAEEQ